MHFGMKAHVGVDAKSGSVHTAGAATGKVHDAKVMDRLIREDDKAVFADKGYVNEKAKRAARKAGGLLGGKGGKGKEKAGPGFVLVAEKTQQAPCRHPGESRACVPGDQIPVRLPQDAPSRH